MRRVSIFALFFFVVMALPVAAETADWEVFGGYAYTRPGLAGLQAQTNLFTVNNNLPQVSLGGGPNASGFNFGAQDNLNHWFSGLVNFSVAYPKMNTDITQQAIATGLGPSGATYTAVSKEMLYTLAFGPQFTIRKNSHVQPFVRVLIGGAHATARFNVRSSDGANLYASDLTASNMGLALSGGGGLDIRAARQVYFRMAVDYVRTSLFNTTEGNLQVSIGMTFRTANRE